MRQVALIACCDDDAALVAIAATGKMGDEHGVTPAAIGARCAGWVRASAPAAAPGPCTCARASSHVHGMRMACAWHVQVREHALRLCEGAAEGSSVSVRLVGRLRRGERERMLTWLQALAAKHAGAGGGADAAAVAAAEEAHKAACKALKKALKKAAEREAAGRTAAAAVKSPPAATTTPRELS